MTSRELGSEGERAFLTRWRQIAPSELRDIWQQQVFAIPGREFRFDFYAPGPGGDTEGGTAVEIDGGIWMPKGGHTTGKGYERDREKDILALEQGITVIRVTPGMIDDDPIRWIGIIVERLTK